MPISAWETWRPRDPELLDAFELWRAGDLDAAERAFRVRLDEPTDEVLRGLGSVLWTRRRFPEAHAAFAHAIRLCPGSAMHWSNLGLVLRDLRAFERALGAFDVALGLDPEYEPAWNERANVLYDLDRPAEAMPLYRRAIALNGRRAVVHHNLGMCLLALRNAAGARAAFEQALKLEPGYGWSVQMLRRLGYGPPAATGGFTTLRTSREAIPIAKHACSM
jgi:tetratricopeptide (TPR) repeat protein